MLQHFSKYFPRKTKIASRNLDFRETKSSRNHDPTVSSKSTVMPDMQTTCLASRRPHVFALGFDWFTGLSVLFVIGQSDYFGFGFTAQN